MRISRGRSPRTGRSRARRRNSWNCWPVSAARCTRENSSMLLTDDDAEVLEAQPQDALMNGRDEAR